MKRIVDDAASGITMGVVACTVTKVGVSLAPILSELLFIGSFFLGYKASKTVKKFSDCNPVPYVVGVGVGFALGVGTALQVFAAKQDFCTAADPDRRGLQEFINCPPKPKLPAGISVPRP